MSATAALAEFVVHTRSEAIPSEAIAKARIGIIDCTGCMLEGSTEPAGSIVRRVVERSASHGGSTVIGGRLASAQDAAFCNGVSSHAIDFDDTSLPLGHPSCTLLPVAYALGEAFGHSGQDVVAAYLLGYDVQGRIGSCGHIGHGFHSTGIYGAVGASAVAARLLRLGVEETRQAFAIAASSASGMRRNAGTMTKPFHAGNACRAGITAALMAGEGLTADLDIFDGRYSFGDTFMGGEAALSPDRMTRGLGEEWHIMPYGPGVKKYPTCYNNHRALDALFELIRAERLAYDDVEAVEVAVPYADFLNDPAPTTGLKAKFSIQYNLGMALLENRIVRETFEDARVRSRAAREAAAKVRLRVDSSIPRDYAQSSQPVTLYLRDGRRLTRQVDTPYGHWDAPLEEADLMAKYRSNAAAVLGEDAIVRTSQMLLSIETLPNIKTLCALFQREPITLS